MEEARNASRAVGLKQCVKAIKSGRAKKVIIAGDAEERIKSNIIELCKKFGIEAEYAGSMKALGAEAGIDVGTSVICII